MNLAMTEWVSKNLGEVCDIRIGGTPSRTVPAYWDSGNATENFWVSIRDLNQRVITETAERLTDLGVKNSNAKLIPADTILLSFKLTIGRVAIAGSDLYTNEAIAALLTEQINNDFLYYGLQHWDLLKGVDQAIKGATLNKEKLKNIEITFPKDQNEQICIATVLSCIDRAIDQTEALIAKQQRIKAGLMQDLLIKGIDEHGNIRSEATHNIEDSILGRIPGKWIVGSIGELCYVTKLAGYEFTKHIKYIEDGEIIALRALNIKNERLDLSNVQRISKKVSDSLLRSKVYKDDILITYIGAYIGDVLLIEENNKYHLAPNVAKIVAGRGLLPEYLEIVMRSFLVQNQIKNLTATTATPSLTMSQIRNIQVCFPKEEDEQATIVEIYQRANEQIESNKKQLVKLKLVKAGLMQGLFTGKVSVESLLAE